MKFSTCKDLHEVREAYLGGDLPINQSRWIEMHLATCSVCRGVYEYTPLLRTLAEETTMDTFMERRLKVGIIANSDNERRTTRHTKRALVLATGIVAAAVLIFFALSSFYPLTFSTEDNPVASISRDSDEKEAQSYQVFSTESEKKSFAISNGTSLWLKPKSSAKLIEHVPGEIVRIHLVEGTLGVNIESKKPDFRFIVSLPAWEVEAHGTIFSVEILSPDNKTIRVIEGSVEVRSKEGYAGHFVHSGEQLTVGDAFSKLASTVDLQDLRCLVQLDSCVRGNTLDNAIEEVGDAVSNLSKPRSSRQKEEKTKGEKDSVKDRIGELTHLARTYRQEGLFQQAAETYAQLNNEFPKSDAAINGLVALAQIEHTLNVPGKALEHFELYLKRRPYGVLAEVVRAGKVRVLFQLGRFRNVVEACDEYLRFHVSGVSVPEIRRRQEQARNILASEQ